MDSFADVWEEMAKPICGWMVKGMGRRIAILSQLNSNEEDVVHNMELVCRGKHE